MADDLSQSASLDAMENKLDDILSSIKLLSERVEKLEVSQSQSADSRSDTIDHRPSLSSSRAGKSRLATVADPIGPGFQLQSEDNPELAASNLLTTSNEPRIEGDPALVDVHRDFESLRDSHSRVTLPSHLKVNDSTRGIKNEFKPTLNILSKCARYAETGLKVLGSNPAPDTELLEKLFTVLSAQISFLQAEYSNLVVRSTFNEETSRLFRSFENNTGAFSQTALNNVRIAAELASYTNQTSQQRQSSRSNRGRPNSFYNYRGRGRFNTSSFNFSGRDRSSQFNTDHNQS